jgi:hypothetical protein
MFGQGVSYHVDSNFLSLLSIASLFLWQVDRRPRWLAAAGALAGLVTCILQPKGALLFCALLLWIWLQSRQKGSLLPALAPFVAGYVAVGALTLMYFWRQGALSSLIYVNFTFPSLNYSGVNVVGYAFGLRDFWNTWAALGGGAIWSQALAWVFAVPYLFLAALPVIVLLLAVLGIAAGQRRIGPEALLLALAGGACWLAEIHRKDIYHLVYGSPLLILLCLHLAAGSGRKSDAIAIRVVAICAVCLAGFNFLMVAAIPHASATRVGTVQLFGQDVALEFLIGHTTPGEAIFVYPYAPAYYFLSATTNPTRYSLLTYNYNTAAQFQEAIATLEQRKIQYVVWDTDFIAKTSESTFPGSQPPDRKDLLMENYLQSQYTQTARFGGVAILQRNPERK